MVRSQSLERGALSGVQVGEGSRGRGEWFDVYVFARRERGRFRANKIL
jgi:hypothetical protein